MRSLIKMVNREQETVNGGRLTENGKRVEREVHSMQKNEVLVIGIGNIGRADDGLGWKFLEAIEGKEDFDIAYRYQLQVEDADLIASYEEVWFIDASHERYPDDLRVLNVCPEGNFTYTSHQLSPEVILFLCHDLFGKYPNTRMLGISGENWNLGEPMSVRARRGLKKALAFFNSTYYSSDQNENQRRAFQHR